MDARQSTSAFPLVGIGASAGGLEAFQQLLANLPDDSGMAFLLVQHLDPKHESRLAGLLGKVAAIPVAEAADGVELRPNHAYVIPPNANMTVAGGTVHITPRGMGHHLPVDTLFRSLAQERESLAIGVVLSGTGSDGTLGVCEIKGAGGITFAEADASARHPGMPRSAVESGCIDFVLPPDEIARRLAEVAAHPYLASAPGTEHGEAPGRDEHFKRVLATVQRVTSVDFSLYRDSTIQRRIMRRMALRMLRDLGEYAERLANDRAETEALYRDLLINVTGFFRDPDTFEALKSRVLPELANSKSPMAPVRVWVPGCSSGQEAYSLAMILCEFYDDRPVRPPLQIFATDLSDQTALEKARAGVYPESIESEVGAQRLARFFERDQHGYRVERTIRDMCVFARQDVTADPPFSRLDLISCRNLLMYLSPPLQKRVLPTFHYALNAPGYLLVGAAETVADGALFEVIDRVHRIYAKKPASVRPALYFATPTHRSATGVTPRRSGPSSPTPADFLREADRVLLGRYAPPGVLINEDLDVLQFRGRTAAYLETPPGEPTTNLLKLARDGLFLELRNALEEAKTRKQPVLREGLRLRIDGVLRELSLEIVPIPARGTEAMCFLVLFHESGEDGDVSRRTIATPSGEHTGDEMIQVRQELAATKEYSQSLVERQETANEELRSANEEILSSNEELQSTNEELETAKEELQSTNEELTTVNEQLHHRNLELIQANDDLTNLISSTDIPLVMVGGDLRIRRFTSPARNTLALLPTDVGRPLRHLRPLVDTPDMEKLVADVIASGRSRSCEVRDQSGRWHELRVYPYRTADRKIDGAVLVLVDIDQHKRAEEALREADRRKDEFLATLAHEIRNPIAPIRNAVEIMQRASGDAATVAQARNVLARQVALLSRIVEDLIDVSRIVEQKIELRKERVSLDAVMDEALETARSFVEACQHRLTVTLPPRPVFLIADPTRFKQVVVNLLNNASKFTDSGGEIWLSADEDPAEPNVLVLRVRDSGHGIQADVLPRIFEMFVQGDAELEAGRPSGLGVGLTLVRSLIQMHGGTIEARSGGAGCGSEFIVRWPLATDAANAAAVPTVVPPRDDPSAESRRILVVDDNRDNAESLGTLLELMGHEVRLAFDGPGALETAAAFVPDVALVDIGLPGMNGYEVARHIRERLGLRKTLLIAQTGWGQDDDRRRSEEAGFDCHFVKPLNPAALKDVLSRHPRA